MSRRARLVAVVAMLTVVVGACDWPMFRSDPGHSGWSPDMSISKAAVAHGMVLGWTFTAGAPVATDVEPSSPTVAGGTVYLGARDGTLSAFDAAGGSTCSGTPKTCRPRWTARTSGAVASSPTIAGGLVYVGSSDHKLYAFDARGAANCSGSPKTCRPLWTAQTGGVVASSATVVTPPGGSSPIAYVGSDDGRLYAFDANGRVNCSGSPKVCTPLWTAATGSFVVSSPAVVNGVVYVGSLDGNVYAFDAAGRVNCSGTPGTCAPLWIAPTGGSVDSSPAVVGGKVYVGSQDRRLYAFDAAGNAGCAGVPKVCTALWTASVGGALSSSPAVADGVVYIGSAFPDRKLYAFDANGTTNCNGIPATCAPLWTATMSRSVLSSPAVAHSVVYVGSTDHHVYAFDGAGTTNCGGIPTTCRPLWAAAVNGPVQRSSPAVANGFVYVVSGTGVSRDELYAFELHAPGR